MTLRLLTLYTLFIGMAIFAYGVSLPYYKNNNKSHPDLSESISDDEEKYKEEYYKYEETYRTNKIPLIDFGSGLCVLSFSFLAFLLVTKTKKISDFKYVRTLGISGIFISANFVWLLSIPGTYWYYMYRAARGDYPPFADSIGLPIYFQIPICLLMLIPLNIFILFSVVKSDLPAPLIVKLRRYDLGRVFLEFFFGSILIINIICLVDALIDGDHALILINTYFVYIILSLRAGIINRYNYVGETVVD